MDYQTRLTNILNKPGNRTCADCNGRNPRWASISLGVFVCIRCCGIHRALGTHISKMKSTTLDKWSPQMLHIFESTDNEISNSYWESNLPRGYNKPVESSGSYAVETFLRDKYERKLWIGTGADPVTLSQQPKKQESVHLKVEKKEDKRNLSAGPIETDLLSDGFHVHAKPAFHHPHLSESGLVGRGVADVGFAQGFPPGVGQNAPSFQSANMNLFPDSRGPGGSNGVQGGFGGQGRVQEGFGMHNVSSAPNFPQAPMNQVPIQGFNPYQGGQPVPHGLHPQITHAQNLEAEKNMKINQVLSMYSAQPVPSTAPNTSFKPLGAIAAQNFFNQNTSYPYPTF